MKKSFGSKTLVFPAPVWCIGSYNHEGRPNVMTVAWSGICCSSPACVTISLRKATYTYSNIMEKMAYTINVPSEKYAKEADYFGMVSGKTKDKFAETGLTPVKSDRVDAPYIAEFPMNVECKVIHTFEIGLHTQFIGEIINVKVDDSLLDENGNPDINKIKPVIFTPNVRNYFGVGDFIGEAFSIGKKFNL